MTENKEKKSLWNSLFASKKKSSDCCSREIEINPEEIKMVDLDHSSDNCKKPDDSKKVIKVLGTGCSSCIALYHIVLDAVEQLGIDAVVEKEEDLQKIMDYNVMSLPALVVNGKVVSKGQRLSVDKVKDLIR